MMQKQDFLEVFEAAILAAKTAARGDGKNSPAVSRCVDAMVRLRESHLLASWSSIENTLKLEKSYGLFVRHKNPRIQSEANVLYSLWLRYLYASNGKKQSPRDQGLVNKKKRVVEIIVSRKTADSNRDKVREILHKSLSKAANEVLLEIQEGVVSCASWSVAASVESAMFERLGSFEGPLKEKYRSILFNMEDRNNPDLRRKVLFGEISGERLVRMEKEEMASNKIQLEIKQIKEKARVKEENRMKSVTMFQSDMLIMT